MDLKRLIESLRIADGDPVDLAVQKALGAEKALLDALSEHFRRVRVLADWIGSQGDVVDMAEAVWVLQLGCLVMRDQASSAPLLLESTPEGVSRVAQRIESDLIAAYHDGLAAVETRLLAAAEPTVVRARAVLAENQALEALVRMTRERKFFDDAVAATWWGDHALPD